MLRGAMHPNKGTLEAAGRGAHIPLAGRLVTSELLCPASAHYIGTQTLNCSLLSACAL